MRTLLAVFLCSSLGLAKNTEQQPSLDRVIHAKIKGYQCWDSTITLSEGQSLDLNLHSKIKSLSMIVRKQGQDENLCDTELQNDSSCHLKSDRKQSYLIRVLANRNFARKKAVAPFTLQIHIQ